MYHLSGYQYLITHTNPGWSFSIVEDNNPTSTCQCLPRYCTTGGVYLYLYSDGINKTKKLTTRPSYIIKAIWQFTIIDLDLHGYEISNRNKIKSTDCRLNLYRQGRSLTVCLLSYFIKRVNNINAQNGHNESKGYIKGRLPVIKVI